jgi:hypothetical protein
MLSKTSIIGIQKYKFRQATMVPRVAKAGQSFKGALAYYLHDKGSTTSERVAWTETRNLGSDNLIVAQAVMIATAKRADELKKAAGIKAGRKATTGPVYAYSLAWSTEEAGEIDRAEMLKAVEASLHAIDAHGRQAIIVCHQDEKHPHVHVILNRVDPGTGKMLSAGDDFKKLSAWALAYREARGEHLKFCPARAEKREKITTAKTATAETNKTTTAAAFEKAAQPPRPAPTVKPVPVKSEPVMSKGATLAQVANSFKERHKTEWADLAAWYKTERNKIWEARPNFKAIAAQHRADTRAEWSKFGKHQAAERQQFAKTERTFSGIFANAFAATSSKNLTVGDKGFLKAVFWHVVSTAARVQSFGMHQAQGKAVFVKHMNGVLDQKIIQAKAIHAAKLDGLRATYDKRRGALVSVHDREKVNIRAGWKEFYAERDKAAVADRGRPWPRRSTPKAAPSPVEKAATAGQRAVDDARRRAGMPADGPATIEEQTDALLHSTTQSPSELRAKYSEGARVRARGERTRAPRTRSRTRGQDDGPEIG